MPKGQVSDDELATGLRGFGGISPFTAPGRPQRDTPFRDTHTDPVPQAVPPKAGPVKAEAASEPEKPKPVERRGENASTIVTAKPRRPVVEKAPVREVEAGEKAREKKTERYTERVTVLLDPELRDGAESLAKDLQRRRGAKGERITANTIMRVSLRVLLQKLAPAIEAAPNDEEEIFTAVCDRIRAK